MLGDYLDLKGITFNLYEFLFGLDRLKMGENAAEITKPRYKLYNAMESEDGSGNTPWDKGKGIDKEAHPFYTGSEGLSQGAMDSDTQPLDKGLQVAPSTEPPLSTSNRIFPGLDITSVF